MHGGGEKRAADPPKRVPTAACSNGHGAAAVHISPKQLYCFSHNEGSRVREWRTGFYGDIEGTPTTT